MKKIYTGLFIVITILISFQNNAFSQTRLGIRGGLNLANINEDLGGTQSFDFEGTPLEITLKQSNRTTFNLGGFAEYWFTPMIALQLNILYNQKGFETDGNLNETIIEEGIPVNVSVDAEETVKLTYLSFPLLVKVAFGESNIKPYLTAGPEIGFLLSGKDYAKATAEAEAQGIKVGPYTVDQEQDIKDMLESMEFALDFGAGLNYSFGNIGVFADFIYSLGITKVNKEELDNSDDIKNQNIMINAGIFLGIQ